MKDYGNINININLSDSDLIIHEKIKDYLDDHIKTINKYYFETKHRNLILMYCEYFTKYNHKNTKNDTLEKVIKITKNIQILDIYQYNINLTIFNDL